MLVSDKVRTLEKFGVQEETSFKIKASKKAFDILSSTIYSDIIKAIIRELSANAWDSHVAAGNLDKKFDVHLPSKLESYFEIRDYGTGLKKEDVKEIFCTYFESTKTNSNDYIGCLGLGSKTPFAYSDNFVIKSFYNGVAYCYSAFVGEDGFPKISLLSEDPTTESNGLLINIAVKESDINSFVTKAQDVYKYFSSKPNLTGYLIDLSDEEVVYEFEEGAVRKKTNADYSRFIICRMGNIGYKVSFDELFRAAPGSYYNRSSFVNDYYYLDLKFEIGDLDIAASRETLQLTEKTVSNVLNRYKHAETICKTKVADEIKTKKDEDTEWNAYLFNNKLSDIFNFVANSSFQFGSKDKNYYQFFAHKTRSGNVIVKKELSSKFLAKNDYFLVDPPSERYVRAYVKEKMVDIIVINKDEELSLTKRGVPNSLFLPVVNLTKVSTKTSTPAPRSTRKVMAAISDTEVQLDIDNSNAYIFVYSGNEYRALRDIKCLFKAGHISAHDAANIYYVPSKRQDIISSTKWQDISVLYKKILDSKDEKFLENASIARKSDKAWLNFVVQCLQDSEDVSAQRIVYLFKSTLDSYESSSNFPIWFDGERFESKLQELTEQTKEKYPLIKYLIDFNLKRNYYSAPGNKEVSEAKDYIRLIDNRK